MLNHKRRTGFTLVELLIVLVIVMLVVIVVVSAAQDRLREAKTMEARDALRQIGEAAQSYYHASHPLGEKTEDSFTNLFPGCEPIGSNVPPVPCEGVALFSGEMPVGEMVSPNDERLLAQAAPWPRLRFLPRTPFYYNYVYYSDVTAGQSSFRCVAIGSLESANDSVFEISGFVDPKTGGLVIGEIEDKSPRK